LFSDSAISCASSSLSGSSIVFFSLAIDCPLNVKMCGSPPY
jgi:hypothetical protein